MPNRLLATKFHAPAWRPGSVARPRLVERLQAGLAAGRPGAPPNGRSLAIRAWLATALGQPDVLALAQAACRAAPTLTPSTKRWC